jgi:glutathione peroxidase
MFAKLEVNGENRHPLYQALTAAKPHAVAPQGSEFLARMSSKGRAPKQTGDILWNFEKFLIGRDGKVIERFSPDTTPEDPALLAAVKQALAD